ncbi:MAG TPA: peptidase [Lachnoclostridium sp.]|nr:peptidase [Lachnoclostridium sp.]
MPKKINVKGEIVGNSDAWIYEWLEIEHTSPHGISKQLAEANGEEIEVEINSPGGNIFAGSEIYTALRSYKGNKKIRIVGLAGSAASVIAEAGESEISPTAMYMIHKVSSYASGNHKAMEHQSEVLKMADESIVNAYVDKTGMSKEELLSMMDKETWLSAQQAVDYGFVDKVMFQDSRIPLTNSIGGIPPETIDKLRNLIKSPGNNATDFFNDDNAEKQKAEARLKLLNLKGDI